MIRPEVLQKWQEEEPNAWHQGTEKKSYNLNLLSKNRHEGISMKASGMARRRMTNYVWYGRINKGDTNEGGANNHKLRELQQEVKLIGMYKDQR